MLGALANGVLLLVVAVLIVVEALTRLGDPPDVAGAGVLALGSIGLAGNVAATWVLAAGERGDINLEGVLRHSAADALSSLGVIAAGVLVLVAGLERGRPDRQPRDRDPDRRRLVAAAEGAGRRAARVGAAPAPTCGRSGEAMAAEPQVVEVHDLHVWTVTSGFPALSAHVVVDRGAGRDEVLARMERMLEDRFDIHHTTLQVVECADPEALIQLERRSSSARQFCGRGRRGTARGRPVNRAEGSGLPRQPDGHDHIILLASRLARRAPAAPPHVLGHA